MFHAGACRKASGCEGGTGGQAASGTRRRTTHHVDVLKQNGDWASYCVSFSWDEKVAKEATRWLQERVDEMNEEVQS